MKLLLVDDDPAVRRLIAAILGPLASEIVECDDGAAALAAYDTHRPDVVLMDVAMRQMNGLAATEAILSRHPDARIVIVSNHDAPDLRDAAARAGSRGYVVKQDLLTLPALLLALAP